MDKNELNVTVLKGGPLMVEGACKITDAKGETIKEGEKVFLCRCGASNNKPFCDGAHKAVEFDN
jgi:CDGSH-type Zn-finger protein